MSGLCLSPAVIPKPIGQVQQFIRGFPQYVKVTFRSQEEMTQVSQESSCRGRALVPISVAAPRTYLLVIISTHLHPGEPGQLGPSGQPPPSPAPSTSAVPRSPPGRPWRWHCLDDGRPLTRCRRSYRAGQACVFPRGPALPGIRYRALAAKAW